MGSAGDQGSKGHDWNPLHASTVLGIYTRDNERYYLLIMNTFSLTVDVLGSIVLGNFLTLEHTKICFTPP
jgi:hypothetical protein